MTDTALFQVKISTDKALGATIMVLLENSYPEPLSVSHYEQEDKSWALTLLYDSPVELKQLEKLINENLEIKSDCYEIKPLPVADIDWVAHVQSELKPVRAGRFFIHGSHDREKATCETNAIEIDAAQAFGTAHHGTTKGCLSAIDQLSQTQSPANILDLGTGSGILAIAAQMVWPDAKLLATDIDPIAIEVAKSNCTLNNQVKIKTLCAEGVDDPTIKQSGPYDLLIANILAKPLIEVAPAIRPLLASNGILLLSGILETQGDDVTNAYTREGLIHKRTDQFDEWVTILFKER